MMMSLCWAQFFLSLLRISFFALLLTAGLFLAGCAEKGKAPASGPASSPVGAQHPPTPNSPVVPGSVAKNPSNAATSSPAPGGAKPQGPRVWLSDLPEINARVTNGFGKNGQGSYGPVRFNGKHSLHALAMHADASVEYQLDKHYRVFRGTAAMNDTSGQGPERPVVFQVFGDGKLLWESAGLRECGDLQECLADVSGVDRLRITAIYDPNRTGHGHQAHAAWLEPYVDERPASDWLVSLFDPVAVHQIRERIEYVAQVRKLWSDDKFDELQSLADKAQADADLLQGRPRLACLYDAVTELDGNYESQWLEHFARFGKWRAAHPDKITSYVAEAESRVGFAFSARGNGWAKDVTSEGWKLFATRLQQIDELLGEGAEKAPLDGQYWVVRSQLARYTGGDPMEPFEAGIKLCPSYYPLYAELSESLEPRWGRKPGELEEVSLGLRDRIGGDEGQEAFGRMVLSTCYYEQDGLFQKTRFDYADVKPAFEVLVRRYPQASMFVNWAARLAYMKRDKEFARRLFEFIGPVSMWSHCWNDEMIFDAVHRWMVEETPPAHRRLVLTDLHHAVESVVFLRDGSRVLACSPGDNAVGSWNPTDGSSLEIIPFEGALRVAASPANDQIVLAGGQDSFPDRTLLLRSVSGKEKWLTGHRSQVRAVHFAPDGKSLASADATSILLWRLNALKEPRRLENSADAGSLAFSPDGHYLASAATNGQIRLWDLESDQSASVGDPHFNWSFLAWSPDGSQLLASGGSDVVRILKMPERQMEEFATKRPRAWSIACSPKADLFAVGLENLDVDLYRRTSHMHVATLSHWTKIHQVAFSPDGKTLAAACYDGTVHLWDVESFAEPTDAAAQR